MNRTKRDISGMHPSVLRRINAIQVFHTLRLRPGISQREVGRVTGIDRSTVSAIITNFDALGILNRRLDESAGRRGRPSEALEIRHEAGLLLAVHVLPERVLFVASGLDGVPTATFEAPSPKVAAEAEEVIRDGLKTLCRQMGRQFDEARAIGICMPGLISSQGMLAESSNLRWHNVDLQALAQRIGPHTYVGNDSRGAGLAEKLFGRCADVEDFIYVDSASGVGGILFLEGSAYTGPGGFAGELGHIKVASNGRLCACGGTGCLSAYISEPALRDRFAQLGLQAPTFQQMRRLAEAGSAEALMALEEAGEMLGIALADYIKLLNPPAIVLGGGLAVLAPFILPGAERSIGRNALASPRKLCAVLVSDLALEQTPRGGLALALGGLTEATGDGTFPW